MTRIIYDLTWGKNLKPGESPTDIISAIPIAYRNEGIPYHVKITNSHLNYMFTGLSSDSNRPYSYTVDTLPAATPDNENLLVFVTDDRNGKVLAASDGTNWRRTSDNTIVSKN